MAAVLPGSMAAVELVMIQRRNEVNALGPELLDVVIRKFHAVLDRVHTSTETVAQTFSSERVARNFMSLIMRLLDERLHLFQRKRRRNHHLAVRCERKFIRGINFDPIRPGHPLFPYLIPFFPR